MGLGQDPAEAAEAAAASSRLQVSEPGICSGPPMPEEWCFPGSFLPPPMHLSGCPESDILECLAVNAPGTKHLLPLFTLQRMKGKVREPWTGSLACRTQAWC